MTPLEQLQLYYAILGCCEADKMVHEDAAEHMFKTSHTGFVCQQVTQARPSALWRESHHMSACFVRMPFVPALKCLQICILCIASTRHVCKVQTIPAAVQAFSAD